MKLKFNLLIVFIFLFCAYGFSQDSIKAKKVIYKIPASEVKPIGCSSETKLLPKEKKSIYSCETNVGKKEAVITTKSADGTISKQTFEIKENK